MKILLDTCVLSEVRRADSDVNVRAFMDSMPNDDLFISVLTLGEITKGVERLPDGKKKVTLSAWIDTLRRVFKSRLVGVDQETAEIWGRITARSEEIGAQLPAIDGLLAATAIRHDFKIATRNVKHFKQTSAGLLDPWQSAG